jgi:hypothetical protein
MNAGNQSYDNLASADANPENAVISLEFILPPGVLREGINVLAIEVHQRSSSSSDLGIDAEVKGTIANSGITLTQSGVLKARLLSPSSEWSALTEAFFTVDGQPASAANTLISKIHYHPAPPSQVEIDAGFTSSSEFEFLEILNHGSETISLTGVTIFGGITFSFPPDSAFELAPGERVVVVENLAAFELRYGAGIRVAGQYSGKLSNDGEEIIMNDSAGAEIWRFTFNDAGAWPDSPDGGGTALTLIDQGSPLSNAALSSPASWRPSASAGGSPGIDDRISFASWISAQPDSDPLADPDGDGINQLIAFATGALDSTEAHAYLPILSIETVDVGGVEDAYPVFSVRLLAGSQGIVSTVIGSGDLSSWASSDLVLSSNTDNGDGTYTLRYRSAVPIDPAASPRQFYQLSVSVTP